MESGSCAPYRLQSERKLSWTAGRVKLRTTPLLVVFVYGINLICVLASYHITLARMDPALIKFTRLLPAPSTVFNSQWLHVLSAMDPQKIIVPVPITAPICASVQQRT